MKSSIQIQNDIHACDLDIDRLSGEFNAAQGDAQAAIHDQICQLKGKKGALYDQLQDAIEAEDKMRAQGGVPLAAPEPEKFAPRNAAEQFLGDPAKFHGLNPADALNVMHSVRNDFQEFSIGTKTNTDYNLPRQTSDALPNFGILSTLPTATTDADVLEFFVPDTAQYINGAKVWTKGETKGKSAFAWKKASAQLETLAHYIPVSKLEMRDYGQLAALVNTELLYGLRAKLSSSIVAGNETNGIKGITVADGIQQYTKKSGDSLSDTIYRMSNDVFLKSGFAATHVAMHPYVTESIVLEKDKNGRYINSIVNGKLFALTVVDDLNLVTDNEGDKYGLAVYWNNAATVFTKHADEVSIGLVNDQFIRNEYTVLAEGTYGLKIARPDAISYLADSGITR